MNHARWSRRAFLRSGGLVVAGAAGGLSTTLGGGHLGAWTIPVASAAGPVKGGTLKVAQIGDPPTLDPMSTTADVTATDGQSIFEGLFALDANGVPQPMLATGVNWSDGSLTLTMPLRTGVLFHDGTPMTAADVVASLKRWLKLAALGQSTGPAVKDVVAKDPNTVVIQLASPVGLLTAYLANPNNMAAIMPRAVIEKFGDKPISTLIGTGPYKFQEWKPDAYIKLVRWDKYVPVNQEPSGYAGRRVAYLDAVDILPIPDGNTRLAGMQSGQFDVGFSISADQYPQITATPTLAPQILKPDQWLIFNLNKKMRIFTNPKIRLAFLKALDNKPIMEAAFGPPEFWSIASPTIAYLAYQDDKTGADTFNHQDVAGAKALLKEAGYNGTPIVWLSTKNYDWAYKGSLVAKQQLEAVGFVIDLQIMDWATLVQRRSKPEIYDVFQTTMGGTPAIPTAMDAFVSDKWPGWWSSPKKEAALQKFTSSVSLPERKAAWSEIQRLYYEEAAAVKIGDAYGLSVIQKRVQGFTNVDYPPFWNVWLST
jgi:peptide/nickel transport system substrate-binding protein